MAELRAHRAPGAADGRLRRLYTRVMDDSSWRVLVLFDRKDDVRSVADFLKAMGEVTAAGGSVSHASGTTCLFAYAPDAGVIEKVARIISSAMDSLAVKPAQVERCPLAPRRVGVA